MYFIIKKNIYTGCTNKNSQAGYFGK
ncbi:unnamed protein product [Psylliodes chrysocephalus]|uniref:Uncharacterized protein n=1 Tax=Psylliodes chrysocephalus TaxID=3402493 RepID=A0A9P0CJG7_9CUCU|nr:unnamed protein product [Psylliodes chrysocephala]